MANTILLSVAVISATLFIAAIIIVDKILGKDYDSDNEWILSNNINANGYKGRNVYRTASRWDDYQIFDSSVCNLKS